MSLIKPMDFSNIKGIRDAINALMTGKVDRIEFSEIVNLRIARNEGGLSIVLTEGKAEVDIPGPFDPDIVEVTARNDRTGTISLTVHDIPFRW